MVPFEGSASGPRAPFPLCISAHLEQVVISFDEPLAALLSELRQPTHRVIFLG